MEDPEVVAAIVAGDPAGLAEAYDRYAMPLYSYSRSMLREPADAADAVQDTFLVAAAKLRDLRDRGKLRPWLYAVARNECFRRLRAGTALPVLDEAADIPAGAAEVAGAVPVAALLPGFREQVLRVIADRSPAGLAHRLTVANRAGPFGPEGFPAPIRPPGAGPWHRILHHRRAIVAGAAVAVVAAGAIVAGVAVGPHPSPSAGPAGGSAKGAPGGSRNLGPGHSSPSARGGGNGGGGGAAGPGLVPSAPPGGITTTPVAVRSPGAPDPVGAGPAASAGNSSSVPSSPGTGTLSASTGRLDLVSANGTATGTFTLTATGGPVSAYSITVGSSLVGHLSVSPASGSLAAGASVTITVTSTSLVALDGQLTVNPGGRVITVVLSISL
jgi:DNA-directed RNA polymerase specialized sigma24 family protein